MGKYSITHKFSVLKQKTLKRTAALMSLYQTGRQTQLTADTNGDFGVHGANEVVRHTSVDTPVLRPDAWDNKHIAPDLCTGWKLGVLSDPSDHRMRFTCRKPKKDRIVEMCKTCAENNSVRFTLFIKVKVNQTCISDDHFQETLRRKMKWSCVAHINHLKDDRWTSHVTTGDRMTRKDDQMRSVKRWRDDLDKYWSDTIWQRTTQDRLTCWRHTDAFVQPQDTTAAR